MHGKSPAKVSMEIVRSTECTEDGPAKKRTNKGTAVEPMEILAATACAREENCKNEHQKSPCGKEHAKIHCEKAHGKAPAKKPMEILSAKE